MIVSIRAFTLCLFLLTFRITGVATAQSSIPYFNLTQEQETWVQGIYSSLNLEQKIGQLIMVPAYSNKDRIHVDSISRLVADYHIGGVIFFQGGPVRQAQMINRLQQEAKVPLMFSIDAEWGLAMRLDSTQRFPYQMALGAIQGDSLIMEMGREIARQAKRVGLQVNFAPVVDINNNQGNPVIGFRSFGEDKERVTAKARAYMLGLQAEQVMASAKHFPGHGDTNVDSHYGLPVIHVSKERLEHLELYPFRELMKNGLGSVMVAHMHIPTLDATPNLASTLSKPIVTGLLKNEMGYEGLSFTDALNMQGVAKYYPPGVVDVKALLAGNDMLLNTMDVPATVREVRNALSNGEISEEDLDKRVLKVLRAKAWLGLTDWKPIELSTLYEDLNSPYSQNLSRLLVEKSLTVLQNRQNTLPLQGLDKVNTATLAIGSSSKTLFQEGLDRYQRLDHYSIPFSASLEDINNLADKLKQYDRIVVGVHGLALKAGAAGFGITAEINALLKELNRSQSLIVAVFGNVYCLGEIDVLSNVDGVVAAYQETNDTQDLASQLIFGGIGADATLPVNVSAHFPIGSGIQVKGGVRMAYGFPERVGISSDQLQGIDSLVNLAIRERATPGAQILIAKDGTVFYHKAFGHQDYSSDRPVSVSDVYDLASITKISTALAAFMHLDGEGEFDVDNTLGEYLPSARGTNKENLSYRNILTHQAGLRAFIPFWPATQRKNGSFKWYTFKSDSSRRFPHRVAERLYIHRNYADKIYREILASPIDTSQGYVYSDLSFVLAPLVIESITGVGFVDYLKSQLYYPIGAHGLTFNPYARYDPAQIVPTEYDSLFRHQMIRGTVHDEGAAMLGGVSGHAGLFGSANEVAKLMHLYLWDGAYGDEQVIKKGVVSRYSKCVYCDTGGNYRALGFDRPSRPGDPNGNAAASAPVTSFGHSGFTGTYSWIDPENGLVYVFLSNRVNPTRENRKLYQLNIRTGILEEVYKALQANKLYRANSGF